MTTKHERQLGLCHRHVIGLGSHPLPTILEIRIAYYVDINIMKPKVSLILIFLLQVYH